MVQVVTSHSRQWAWAWGREKSQEGFARVLAGTEVCGEEAIQHVLD